MNLISQLIILGAACLLFSSCTTATQNNSNLPTSDTEHRKQISQQNPNSHSGSGSQLIQAFRNQGLSTNTAKISIPAKEILDGGPGKDGIPSIDNPIFLTQADAEASMAYLDGSDEGIMVVSSDQAKFYSFDILVWHEIVNDNIGDTPIAVTFCPLCGSSIVFERLLDGQEYNFGVSGKLYNSNLLMYDRFTESLWSQSRGEALVGDLLGTKLQIFNSTVLSYEDFKALHPTGLVLSDKTGSIRNYSRQPYGNYADTNDLIFPVNHEDIRLPRKELLYIVNDGDTSVAFVRKDLVSTGRASIVAGEKEFKAIYADGNITVTQNGKKVPGYHEMWFSWMTHNQNTKNIWTSSDGIRK